MVENARLPRIISENIICKFVLTYLRNFLYRDKTVYLVMIIPGYDMSRADHPSGNQCGGVCIYYKEVLPIKMLNINYLQEMHLF